MGTINIFDALIIVSGLYMIYTAFNMKHSGKITSGVLISKDVDVDKIRDKDGFIKYMFNKVLVMGILTCLIGLGGMLLTKINAPSYVMLIGMGCFIIVLILFTIATYKAKKKFVE